MSSTSGSKDIATRKSNHGCVTPPAMSLAPPTPPAGPVPMPFVYTARSATATQTEDDLKVSKAPVLRKGSVMEVDKPGNQPAQPVQAVGGGDVITHAICGVAVTQHGTSGTLANGKEVCRTGDSVRMAVITKSQQLCQATVPLLRAGAFDAALDEGGKAAGDEKRVKAALLALGAKEAQKSSAGHAPDLVSDPVDVASGQVMDKGWDVELPGAFPLAFFRSYGSGRHKERTSLGKGGWTHNFEQWVEEREGILVLRWVDGREVYFKKPAPGESVFHRRERLSLSLDQTGFVVYQHGTRRSRIFEPSARGGRAPLRQIRDVYGHTIELCYEGERLAKIIDTVGREVRMVSDERGRLTRLEVWAQKPAPLPPFPARETPEPPMLLQWVDYAYHPEGELASATDALGNAECYEYDGQHRLVKKTLRSGLAFHYEYDDDLGGFCVGAYGDGGLHAVRLTPNFSERTTLLSGSYEPRRYTWNEDGMVLREETPDGSFARVCEYDEDLYLLSESNAAGEAWKYAYDERGNCINATDPAGNSVTWEYEGDVVLRATGPDGHITTFTHDARGALTAITHPTGLVVTIERDVHGRVTGIHGPDGAVMRYAYDEHHNRAGIVDARGARTIVAFDGMGRARAWRDALGRVSRVDYDAIGRAVAVYGPEGSVRRVEYDPLGNVTRATDAAGRETLFDHRGIGARTAVTLPDGQRFTFEHDEDERLCRVKNPRAELYELEYDAAGRVERERTFDGRVIEYRYSKAGRVARVDYPDGTHREFAYDPLGNIVEDRSPHGTISFARDAFGRVLEATVDEPTGKVVTKFERDAFGRVIAEAQGGRVIRYEHDARGRRVSRALPDGATTRYFYDPANALAALEHAGHRLLIERDARGRPVRTHVYQGRVDIQRAYDLLGRLVSQRVSGGERPTVLAQREYAYDDHGRPTRVDDDHAGTTLLRYDARGRLTEARGADRTEVFDYDATGALVQAMTAVRGAPALERWATLTGDRVVLARGVRYSYDARGRRVRMIEPASAGGGERVTEYEWDCRDRLREVRLPDGRRLRFAYDAFGRRVRKEIVPARRDDYAAMARLALEKGKDALPRSRVIETLWDGNDPCAEYEDGVRRRAFVHQSPWHLPLLQDEGGAVFTYVNDALGMPKELVDAEGRIAWRAAHSAWGEVRSAVRDPQAKRAVTSPFRLLGQYADEETGLCYVRHRYFDPALGRFCSPDPLGFAGGLELYGFNGPPTANVDPMGLANLCEPTRSREDARREARQRAGLGPDDEPVDAFSKVPGFKRQVGDMDAEVPIPFSEHDSPEAIVSKLGTLGNYEVHLGPDPDNPGQQRSVVVVEHPSDPNNPQHFHAGKPPQETTDSVNFPYRSERYSEIEPQGGGDPHIYYSPE
ncbi:RHS repeat-associated core domain-containing protein [Polyangium aurulentum]|uniref:RHS repeat-associated core domain-containing protein n=1 Tax=Polyangium aurulentum TaxID=2567896 RepID=UPI0010AE770E|nr:RHS repeat-associated core domain-containing protein [Polyangium aurulentum]UQA63179.1 RHS domain-containing protein [Polyangium aurulentum]